jgi:hypothetical protein
MNKNKPLVFLGIQRLRVFFGKPEVVDERVESVHVVASRKDHEAIRFA